VSSACLIFCIKSEASAFFADSASCNGIYYLRMQLNVLQVGNL
jgi:hypothetical protein